jgi:uncharacterized membrane protein YccC
MSPSSPPPGFTPSERAGLDMRRVDQDRTLDAVHRLETALGAAAPGRERGWLREVLGALATLDEVMGEEQRNADAVDSLLSDVARTQPRLRTRVRGLRSQYRHVRDTIEALRAELEVGPDADTPDVADIRRRLAWLLASLRHQRSRESDLIYEAYYDAFNTEIETDTGR